jgi:hypothetical protein
MPLDESKWVWARPATSAGHTRVSTEVRAVHLVELSRPGVIVAEEMDMTDNRQQSVSPPTEPPGATPPPAPGTRAGWGQPPERPGWSQPSASDRQLRQRQEMIDAALPLLAPASLPSAVVDTPTPKEVPQA